MFIALLIPLGNQPSIPAATYSIYPTPPSDTILTRPQSIVDSESLATATQISSRSDFASHNTNDADPPVQVQPSAPSSSSFRGRRRVRLERGASLSTSNSIRSDEKRVSSVSTLSRLESPTSFDMYQHMPRSSNERRRQSSFSPLADGIDSPQTPPPQLARSSVLRRPSTLRPRAKSGSELTVRSYDTPFYLLSHSIFEFSHGKHLKHMFPLFQQVHLSCFVSLVGLIRPLTPDLLHLHRLDRICSSHSPRTHPLRCQSC
jgi:hypothetical protein